MHMGRQFNFRRNQQSLQKRKRNEKRLITVKTLKIFHGNNNKINPPNFFFSGIAFPVCISANSCICHFSPIKSEPDHIIAKDDVLKM